MQALLIATNETNHLDPLSQGLPPALLPVANQPVILYNIDLLARQGVKTIITCLHQHAGAMESYLGSGQRWGVTLDYSLQRDSLGTAGSLAWTRGLLTETFLVLPAHILIDLNLADLLAQHNQQGNLATIVVKPAAFDSAAPDKAAAAARPFVSADWQTTGVYLFEPQALDFIPPRTPFDIDTELIPALLDSGLPVRAHPMRGYWNPLATFHQYREAQHILLRSSPVLQEKAPAPLQFLRVNHPHLRPGVWVGANSMIHPSARITPPALIGENCRIGRDVEIGPDAIVGNDVIVDDGVTIRFSTILDHTYLGRLVNLENRIVRPGQIIDTHTGQSVNIVDEFLISATHQSIVESPLRRMGDSLLALLLLVLSLPFTIFLAACILLAFGRVFQPVPRLRPASRPSSASVAGSRPFSTETFSLLRFFCDSTSAFGSWLERWQLNRIPELWNVVTGDLDMVGIHPAEPNEYSSQSEPWQEQMLHSRPGFSGLWFTQTSPNSLPEEIQLADAYYAATRSPSQDLSILRQTPAAWLRRARQASPLGAAGSLRT